MTAKHSRRISAATSVAALAVFLTIPAVIGIQAATPAREKAGDGIDPATQLWYTHPTEKWENGFPRRRIPGGRPTSG